MSAPLPNGFVVDARNAKVGAVSPSFDTQRRTTQFGTRSHLFSTKIRCLCVAWVLRCVTTRPHLRQNVAAPSGRLVSPIHHPVARSTIRRTRLARAGAVPLNVRAAAPRVGAATRRNIRRDGAATILWRVDRA